MNRYIIGFFLFSIALLGGVVGAEFLSDNGKEDQEVNKSTPTRLLLLQDQETTEVNEEDVPFWYNLSERELYNLWADECRKKNIDYDDVFSLTGELRDSNTPEIIIKAAKICQKIKTRWLEKATQNNHVEQEKNARELLEKFGE